MILSREELKQELQPYTFFAGAGVFGICAVIYWAYPLLDRLYFLAIGLGLFVAPSLLFYLPYGFDRPFRSSRLAGAKKVQMWSGIAVWFLLALVVGNGALDRSAIPTQTTVISKGFTEGRGGGKSYYVIVESWRPGGDTERLSVDETIYEGAIPGSTVTIDAHKGFFGWPWYGDVEMQSFRGTLGAL